MHAALNDSIFARVVSAIRATSFPADVPVAASARLGADLGLDSLDIVELAMCIEEAFDIEFPSEVVMRFETVADVVGYLSCRFFRDVEPTEAIELDAALAVSPPVWLPAEHPPERVHP